MPDTPLPATPFSATPPPAPPSPSPLLIAESKAEDSTNETRLEGLGEAKENDNEGEEIELPKLAKCHL